MAPNVTLLIPDGMAPEESVETDPPFVDDAKSFTLHANADFANGLAG